MRLDMLIGIKSRKLIIDLSEFSGLGYTHSNDSVVRFKILLWLFIWTDCIDLETQQKGRYEDPQWLFDHLSQVYFSNLVKCIKSCIWLWYVSGCNETWQYIYLFILNNLMTKKWVIKVPHPEPTQDLTGTREPLLASREPLDWLTYSV